MFLCLWVSWRGRDLKQWATANSKMYIKKQIYIPQKLTYLLAKRGFFGPFFLTSRHGSYRKRILQTETTETTHLFFPATSWKWHSNRLHNCLLCLSSLRRSRDVKTDIWIFNILNSICLIYCLSYIFILYIYLFIYFIFLFSAVRFLILQTPLSHRQVWLYSSNTMN